MQTLELAEYEPHPIHFPLDKGQLSAFDSARIAVTPSQREGETYVLRPSSYIGAVNTPGLSIVVRPKIPIDRVMFLIAYAIDPKYWRQESFSLSPNLEVLESLILAFTHHTRQAVRRGLLQGYRREEEALHTVRGRVRFQEQISRRFGLPLPIEVTFDEFTEDIEENRLLKAALHRLARLRVRSAQAKRGITGLRPVFNTIFLDNYRRGTPEIQYTRLNEHYRPAVELARLVIENSSLELFHGEVIGSSFLIDMNKVFEKFLYVALGEVLGLSENQWKHEERVTLDKGRQISMYPDLSGWNGSQPIFVGDAKYKNITEKSVPEDDLYQMLAYVTAMDLPGGLLVYAKDEAEERIYDVRNADRTIEVAGLNLRGKPEDILGEVRRIAKLVKAQSCLATTQRAA